MLGFLILLVPISLFFFSLFAFGIGNWELGVLEMLFLLWGDVIQLFVWIR